MRWVQKAADSEEITALAIALENSFLKKESKAAQTLARLLVNRGINDIESAQTFLSPSISQLHSPYLMSGMKVAVDRIEAAIERKEPILIYGDYDVDGTTAIVILKTAIELCGGTADFHVPHRIQDGYGMKDDVIERAAAEGMRLIISVDMGIRAFAPADTARRVGVDLIVTDHHLPGLDGVPNALAVMNPNQAGCEYPCKVLCGAAVAFKLAQGLLEQRKQGNDLARLLTSFLKVVAIATVADAVPLIGENRVFAKLGLEALRSAVNPGLKALLEVAQLGGRPLTSGEVAFRLAPRINAAGRMDVASDVVELFSVKDCERAREIATRLDGLNAARQEEERRILESIQLRFDEDATLKDAFCLVIDGDGWHRGVIGITATRVVERYGRPALVISRDGDEAHGSGRSIAPFHLLNALEACRELFTRYGGHSHAVGFALHASRVPELKTQLDTYARRHLTLADFEPVLNFDAELALDQVTPDLFQLISRLEPFGSGNPEPVFTAAATRLMAPPRVLKEKHVKLKLAAAENGEPRTGNWRQNLTFSAMGWRLAERVNQEQILQGDELDIAFTISRNEHPDFGGLELSLRDFRRASKVSDSSQKTA